MNKKILKMIIGCVLTVSMLAGAAFCDGENIQTATYDDADIHSNTIAVELHPIMEYSIKFPAMVTIDEYFDSLDETYLSSSASGTNDLHYDNVYSTKISISIKMKAHDKCLVISKNDTDLWGYSNTKMTTQGVNDAAELHFHFIDGDNFRGSSERLAVTNETISNEHYNKIPYEDTYTTFENCLLLVVPAVQISSVNTYTGNFSIKYELCNYGNYNLFS